MDELHRIHKDVPFGYWVEWVVPAYRWLTRRLRAPSTNQAATPRLPPASARKGA